MNKNYVISLVCIVIVLAAFVMWLVAKHPRQMASQTSSVASRAPLPKETVITLTKYGYTPNQITVKVGTSVRWKNESGAKETVNSDNYPTNQLHRELNFGIFNNGSSVTYTFRTPGTYGYHNQLNHTQEGKVIVIK